MPDTQQLLVVDLECTCSEDGSIPREDMETIEIGAVLVHPSAPSPIAEFQSFVRPELNPLLTPFCRKLTGIDQRRVDSAPRFPVALENLVSDLWQGRQAVFCSWGQFDWNQLHRDCERHGVGLPFGTEHLNLKVLFGARQGTRRQPALKRAVHMAGLTFSGSHHRALDDARNIVKLLPWILGGDRPSLGIGRSGPGAQLGEKKHENQARTATKGTETSRGEADPSPI